MIICRQAILTNPERWVYPGRAVQEMTRANIRKYEFGTIDNGKKTFIIILIPHNRKPTIPQNAPKKKHSKRPLAGVAKPPKPMLPILSHEQNRTTQTLEVQIQVDIRHPKRRNSWKERTLYPTTEQKNIDFVIVPNFVISKTRTLPPARSPVASKPRAVSSK